MKQRINTFFLLATMCLSLDLFAETPHLGAYLLPLTIGVIGGQRPATSVLSSLPIIRLKRLSDGATCTGTIIENCVITARNCLGNPTSQKIKAYTADRKPLTKLTESDFNGALSDEKSDLAILKLTTPAPASLRLPFESLSGNKMELERLKKQAAQLVVAGFGVIQYLSHPLERVRKILKI